MRTHVTFVLDSSGSMSAIEDDTVGGFNTFLREQRDEPGTATVTLYDFDTTVERVYRARPIEDAPELDDQYTPSGRTALHDAIATAIDDTTEYVAGLDDEERPSNVIVVVLTDGKENASETPDSRVRELVVQRREEAGWEFFFVGANQDAALTATKMGMNPGNSLDMAHSSEGARRAYESTSECISEARRHGTTDGYTDSDRRRQEEVDES